MRFISTTGEDVTVELRKTLIQVSIDGFTLSGHLKVKTFKPALRLLPDMTEEEKVELSKYLGLDMLITPNDVDEGILNMVCNPDRRFSPAVYYNAVPFLLSKHFDLFGLIKVGLAIDKTKELVNA